MDEKLRAALESDVRLTHERFCAAMEARFPTIPEDSLERYFGLLSTLVQKLEDPEKQLGDIMQEMMSQAAALIVQEMQARRS